MYCLNTVHWNEYWWLDMQICTQGTYLWDKVQSSDRINLMEVRKLYETRLSDIINVRVGWTWIESFCEGAQYSLCFSLNKSLYTWPLPLLISGVLSRSPSIHFMLLQPFCLSPSPCESSAACPDCGRAPEAVGLQTDGSTVAKPGG